MFLPPDMACIKTFRKSLRQSLEANDFKNEDIVQIELAADEAITNSISANVTSNSEETIICRWLIRDMKITLFILDYGSGFKKNPVNDIPEDETNPNSMKGYLDKVKSHQASKPDCLPFNGIKMGHKNIGKGLKIIYSLMDSVKILFHSNGVVVDSPDESNVSGSIVELEYDVKKRASA
ncbi:MAG: ATP-binding protein [Leptospira sp.]|nr:ATP-binding protein [Leptospira sp.]